MISITAQNEYFDALLSMLKGGANHPTIDRLYENMIAEFQNNKIGLNDDEQNKLLANLKLRFDRFSGERRVRDELRKFAKDEWILRPYPHIIKLIEKDQKKDPEAKIKPLDFIDPSLLDYFLNTIEKNVCGENGKWQDSNIRLAAFCELLYENKYFTLKPTDNKSRPLKFINNFSKSRYGQDILNSLHATKKEERKKQKTNMVDKKPPLRNYFKNAKYGTVL